MRGPRIDWKKTSRRGLVVIDGLVLSFFNLEERSKHPCRCHFHLLPERALTRWRHSRVPATCETENPPKDSISISAALLIVKSILQASRWASSASGLSPPVREGYLRVSDLYQLIQENCPDAVKTGEIKNQFGRKVAIVSPGRENTYTYADAL